MKKSLLICLVAMFIWSLLGFRPQAEAKITITYWTAQIAEKLHEIPLKMLKKMCPDIKVKFTFISSGEDMADKQRIAIAAGTPPNVIWDYSGRVLTLAAQDVLEDLSGLYTKEELDDFQPFVLEQYISGDSLFAMSTWFTPLVYYVNKTILDEYGLWNMVSEDKEITLDTWMQIAEKVSDPPNRYAIAWFSKGYGGHYYMLWPFQTFGADVYRGDDYTKTVLNCEAGIETLEWMQSVIQKGYAPKGAAGFNVRDFTNFMFAGKTVFWGAGPLFLNDVTRQKFVDNGRSLKKWELRAVAVPHKEGIAVRGPFPISNGICVVKQDDPKIKDAAFRIVKALASREMLEYWLQNTSNLTHTKIPIAYFSARKSVSASACENMDDLQFLLDYTLKYGFADLGERSPFYNEIRSIQMAELQAFFMGKKTAEQTLIDFEARAAGLWENRK